MTPDHYADFHAALDAAQDAGDAVRLHLTIDADQAQLIADLLATFAFPEHDPATLALMHTTEAAADLWHKLAPLLWEATKERRRIIGKAREHWEAAQDDRDEA